MRGVVLAVIVLASVALAEDRPAVVEIAFPEKQVPADLKNGERVEVVAILGASISATGKVENRTKTMLSKVEVAKVEKLEKPADPERPIQVTFQPATKDQADKLTTLKNKMLPASLPGGGKVLVPLPLRLEHSPKE